MPMTEIRALAPDDPAITPLRSQVLTDRTAVLQVSRGGQFSLSYAPMAEAVWRVFPADERAALLLGIRDPSCLLLGAFAQGCFVGEAVVWMTAEGWGEILDLRVDVSHRLAGVGRALIDACRGAAAERGAAGLRVTARDDQAGLCQFLERCGFRVHGMDRLLFARMPGEAARPAALFFYRLN